MSESVQLDFSKLVKGAKVRLRDGRVSTVSGLYLSATGPSLMLKATPGQTTAENVNLEMVLEILEG